MKSQFPGLIRWSGKAVPRQIDPSFLVIRKSQKQQALTFDWLHFLFGSGAAVLSGSAAIQSQLGGSKALTGILAGTGTLCVFVNTAFNFGSRYSKASACRLHLDQAFVKYQTDDSLSEAWLGEQVAKALDDLK